MMHMFKGQSPLEGMPLPTAALVIDTRSNTSNYIIETLKYEIDTLCREMHMENVNQWRYLTHIIDYFAVTPLSPSEMQKYRNPYKPQTPPTKATSSTSNKNRPTTPPESDNQLARTLMGTIDIQPQRRQNFFQGAPQRGGLNDIPEGNFKDSLRHILARCDELRTKRVNATMDLGSNGLLGATRTDDGMVRVILIADAQNNESLSTAATYAAYLRREMRYQNIYDECILLSTVIICLNHENRGQPPRDLIDHLSWESNNSWPHIDSCILVENYSEHGARLNLDTQEEHIEFLLYILLITDPAQLRLTMEIPDIQELLPSEPDSKYRMLPVEKCFTVGLSAFTYSVRWGSMLLNNGLARHIVSSLHALPQTQGDYLSTANKWFDAQLGVLNDAIPDQLAASTPDLHALTQARSAVRTADAVFPTRGRSLHVSEESLTTLDNYAEELQQTYTGNVSSEANLQQLVDHETTLQENTRKWQGDAGSPLMTVLNNAHRVLLDKSFFEGASASIPRARTQLQNLAVTITEHHNTHTGNPINPTRQREQLKTHYERERTTLDSLQTQFPFFGSHFLTAMAVVTLLLWLFVGLVIVLTGMAWLYDITKFHASPIYDFFTYYTFDNPFLSVFSLITLIIIIGVVLTTISICRRTILNKQRTPLGVEIGFLLSLFLFTIFGIVISLSLGGLVRDQISFDLIAWLIWLPYLAYVSALILVIVLAFEIAYFFRWHNSVVAERLRLLESLNTAHGKAVDEIHHYLAESVLLVLMKRTQLIDESGTQTGAYYNTLEQLNELLINVQPQIEKQFQLTLQQLERITENQTQGPASSKLYLREELLDLQAIRNQLAMWQSTINTDPMFTLFAELLLRMAGNESTSLIFTTVKPPLQAGKNPFQVNRNLQEVLTLSSIVAALAIEVSLEQPAFFPKSIDTLEKRYKGLDHRYQYTLMKNLLERLKTSFAHRLGENKDEIVQDIDLAVQALTTWAQVLWKNDDAFQNLLVQENVLAHMERQKFSQETIRTKFIIRTAPTARSIQMAQQTDTYLVSFPPAKGTKLLRDLDLARMPVPFPDEEVLALLALSHYVSMPYVIEEEETKQLPSGSGAAIGAVTNSETVSPEPEPISVSPEPDPVSVSSTEKDDEN